MGKIIVDTPTQQFITRELKALRLRISGWTIDIAADPHGVLESSSSYPRLCDVLAEEKVLALVANGNPKTWEQAINLTQAAGRILEECKGPGDLRSKEMVEGLDRWVRGWQGRFRKKMEACDAV